MLKIFVIITLLPVIYTRNAIPCARRVYPGGLVCVCNATYCDNAGGYIKLETEDQLIVVSTSHGGLRFDITEEKFISSHGKFFTNEFEIEDAHYMPNNTKVQALPPQLYNIKISSHRTRQKMLGFGAAITGVVADILTSISQPLQDNIFKSLYSVLDGLGMNMMRIPIGGTDFDKAPWTYAEYPVGDTTLSNFTTLYPTDQDKVKIIKRIETVTKNNGIRYFATPWSTPRWMKSNNDWSGKNELLPQYYQTWADYYIRWLELWKEKNITFWGISTGNEPTNSYIAWNLIKIIDLGWDPIHQAKWIAENLGPTIRNSPFKDIKIIYNDDESYTIPWWLELMEKVNKNVSQYVDGTGLHWYLDRDDPVTYLYNAYYKDTSKFLFTSESCITGKPLLGSWEHANRYVLAYNKYINHCSQGWIHWNMLLNLIGGPTYVGHANDAMIIVNETSKTEFYKQPIYYGIGHFIKFVPEGSLYTASRVASGGAIIDSTSFIQPDGTSVVVVVNTSIQKIKVVIVDNPMTVKATLPPLSVHTFLYKRHKK